MEGLRIVAHQLLDRIQRLARLLLKRRGGPGHDHRRAFGPVKRLIRVATRQRDIDSAEKALRLKRRLRRASDGGVAINGKMRVDGVEIGGVEGQARDLPDTHAIEGDRAPLAVRRDRLEPHDELVAAAQAALVLDPQRKAKARQPCQQGEEANED